MHMSTFFDIFENFFVMCHKDVTFNFFFGGRGDMHAF